ncbi:AP3-complex subunit beta-A isoform X2 [Phalaenopsis equestris]|uniref:AP3-complex subunit beta-A isoform X2 n=1 Tax=Phalaenopsis equestris TaxID=78828 RepID=UPI0009E41B8A|nr:AP3-complex subunit beta-A isoform X2 [Phalaenopsis equestris]
MFPQFGAATADSLSRASTLVYRIGTDAHLYDDPDDVNIAPLLDSRFDSEKCEALKRLLALIAQGVDVCKFFPQVVKNVASQSLEVKKLAYLYLLHYAEKRPNEALLSINCFQKDLSDLNPLVRAWALRSMAGIHLHIVSPLVLAAIRKCARDPSAYVRKCAANALSKLLDLLPEENTELEELVNIFLSDHSLVVVGASAVAFKTVCLKNLSLIGKHFRRLCEAVPDIEEWGQITLIEILLRYLIARHGLVRESVMFASNATESFHSNWDSNGLSRKFENHSSSVEDVPYNFNGSSLMLKNYIEGWEEYLLQCERTNGNAVEDQNQQKDVVPASVENDDVRILLQCTLPLLWSQNSAVVLAVCGVHWIMAPKDKVDRIVKPILFLLRSFPDSKYVVLCNIQVFSKVLPSLFAPYYEDFFVHSSDIYQIRALKLEILSAIATDASIQFILEEFQDYIKDPDRKFVADTVAAIGICAQRIPSVVDASLEGLLGLASQESSTSNVSQKDGEACILVQAIMSIKSIIKHNPAKHEKVILSAQKEDRLMFEKILSYILQLAKYDVDYDIRDRARMAENLISPCEAEDLNPKWQNGNNAGELLENIFRGNKHSSRLPDHDFRFYLPGSLSHVVLHAAPGYEPLPKPHSLHENLSNGIADEDVSRASFDSESSTDENGSYNVSEPSATSSIESDGNESASASHDPNNDEDKNENPHFHPSESHVVNDQTSRTAAKNLSKSISSDLVDLMSRTAFESWLDDHPGLPSETKPSKSSSTRISVNDLCFAISRKLHTLLDSANGNGLRVEYSFLSEASELSPSLVCIELLFSNCSNELLTGITMEDGEPNRSSEASVQALEKPESSLTADDGSTIIPIEEIIELNPGQTVKRNLQVQFHHHLLPLKLAVLCNGRRYAVKLWPDIGYFIKPLSMNVNMFLEKESELKGMFECAKSCLFESHIGDLKHEEQKHSSFSTDKILVVSRSLASKVLSHANVFLVSIDMPASFSDDDASGLHLRFSSEISRISKPCLTSIAVIEGKCYEPLNISVKINCEETVFGLNLLNRFVSFLH